MHLWANYKAVSGVILEKLNRQRADLVLDQFLKDGTTRLSPYYHRLIFCQAPCPIQPKYQNENGSCILTLRRFVAHKNCDRSVWHIQTILGCSISNLVENNYDELVGLIGNSNSEKFLLKQTKKSIVFAIHKEAQQTDILKAYFTAELMHRKQYKSSNETTKLFDTFLKKLDASGWNTEHYLLGVTEWRCTWDSSFKTK